MEYIWIWMELTHRSRLPDWFRIRFATNHNYAAIKKLVKSQNLHTVCEEAHCPNVHECWGRLRTATFMILGDTCTRDCRFCSVKTGPPSACDHTEPQRIAESVASMKLQHVVVTMVTRDDLEDGGAWALAETVRAIHSNGHDCAVEVLSSDLGGQESSIRTVVESRPEIVGHNIETVRRLTSIVRARSSYARSLQFLRFVKQISAGVVTKSSLMLGLGETESEVLQALDDLRDAGVSIVNLGQYLQPSRLHIPVQKYWHVDEFEKFRTAAIRKGFSHCEAGPLVRSSFHAHQQFEYSLTEKSVKSSRS